MKLNRMKTMKILNSLPRARKRLTKRFGKKCYTMHKEKPRNFQNRWNLKVMHLRPSILKRFIKNIYRGEEIMEEVSLFIYNRE